jgi:hypothetical protein
MSAHGNSIAPARFESALIDSPQGLGEWLHRLDPAIELVMLGSQFVGCEAICGRRVIGWRRPAWAEWEDKTIVEERLARLGVATPRSIVLRPTQDGVTDAWRTLDVGLGVVVAMCGGDDRGGGTALHVVRESGDLLRLEPALRQRAARVRVAEFVRGLPCSVIGMVLGRTTIVFDPIEIVTLFDKVEKRFVFCGSSTYWRPSTTIVDEIRSVGRSVGEELARADGFRGGFSVDGILTARGFLATEINARHASGLGLRQASPDFPAYLFGRSIIENPGDLAGVDAGGLELAAREEIRAQPSFSIKLATPRNVLDAGTLQQLEATHGITFVPTPLGRGVRITGIERRRADGVVGSIVAAFARALGSCAVVSPLD